MGGGMGEKMTDKISLNHTDTTLQNYKQIGFYCGTILDLCKEGNPDMKAIEMLVRFIKNTTTRMEKDCE